MQKITQEVENALRIQAGKAMKDLKALPNDKRNDISERAKIMQEHYKPFKGIIRYVLFKHQLMVIAKGD